MKLYQRDDHPHDVWGSCWGTSWGWAAALQGVVAAGGCSADAATGGLAGLASASSLDSDCDGGEAEAAGRSTWIT